jgi:dUTP pyrophosphatase
LARVKVVARPTTKLTVPTHQLDPDVALPTYAHGDDAGADLCARRDVSIPAAGGRALVPTGLVVSIPTGYAGFIQPRSGLALRHGVTCLNTPGLIDSGYRGEVSVLLVNTDPHHDYEVRRGDRVAQLVIQRVERARFIASDEEELPLSATRGEGGFGHTGR